jgi:hypothetical protein
MSQVMQAQGTEQTSQGMDLATQVAQVLKSPEILAILAAQQSLQSSEAKKQKFNSEASVEESSETSKAQKNNRSKQQNKGKQKKGPFCIFHDDRVGHRSGQCPMNHQDRVASLVRLGQCANCRGKNHTAEQCRNNNTCHNCPGDQVNKHMTVLCTKQRRGQQPGNPQEGQNGGQPAPPQPGQNPGDGFGQQ